MTAQDALTAYLAASADKAVATDGQVRRCFGPAVTTADLAEAAEGLGVRHVITDTPTGPRIDLYGPTAPDAEPLTPRTVQLRKGFDVITIALAECETGYELYEGCVYLAEGHGGNRVQGQRTRILDSAADARDRANHAYTALLAKGFTPA